MSTPSLPICFFATMHAFCVHSVAHVVTTRAVRLDSLAPQCLLPPCQAPPLPSSQVSSTYDDQRCHQRSAFRESERGGGGERERGQREREREDRERERERE